MRLSEVTIARLEWNEFNGFILHLLYADFTINDVNFEGSLFGIQAAKTFLYVDLFYFQFRIIQPFTK